MSREPIDIGAIAELPPYARELVRANVDLQQQVDKLQSALRRADRALERHATPFAGMDVIEAGIELRGVEMTVHYRIDDDAYWLLAAYVGATDVLPLIDRDELSEAIDQHEQFKARTAREDRAEDIAQAQAEARAEAARAWGGW